MIVNLRWFLHKNWSLRCNKYGPWDNMGQLQKTLKFQLINQASIEEARQRSQWNLHRIFSLRTREDAGTPAKEDVACVGLVRHKFHKVGLLQVATASWSHGDSSKKPWSDCSPSGASPCQCSTRFVKIQLDPTETAQNMTSFWGGASVKIVRSLSRLWHSWAQFCS